ncbi:hypothetical protein OZN62_03270 [Aurantiacibacter sp. MUD11]|uniref:hypothetical protein n=1 Tax=Aurantiacibacter sp. MUD11 TaxID=3003265 RepID=UPI0022AA789F|nr:hypothetical protein [Aurantiacibacter sp. MUD11]WAT18616.1 hypothetical protein OZN62_03270 [Aurantiacibacter sp. MUD11]
MQKIRKLAKWVGISLLVVIAIGLVWPWTTVLKERFSASEYVAYLEDHTRPLDLTSADGGLQFPASFYDNKLFLLGEIHGAQTAQQVDLAMMIHLNRRLGLTWLMAELSPVQAERFNAYLDTGDESFIAPVFERWLSESAQWGNQQHYDKLIALRDYNQSQPEDRQIRYFGVDLIRENQQQDAAQWLARLLADVPDEAPAEIADLKRAVSGSFDAERLRPALEAALPILAESSAIEPEVSQRVRYIARNLLASLDGAGRYDVIPDNIRTMVEEFGIGDDEPIYGFWGLFHVMKTRVNETGEPMALRLQNSDLPFADGIASVLMVYADSSQNMPSRALPGFLQDDGPYTDFTMSQDNPYLSYLYGIGDLKRMTDAPATLYSPFEPRSPYIGSDRLRQQSGLLTYVFRFELEDSTEPEVDHVILINGSDALTPWQGEGQ